MIEVSVCCPVCRAWFYPTRHHQKYCTPEHKRIGTATLGRLSRRKRLKSPSDDHAR